jgi:hypothetical protein
VLRTHRRSHTAGAQWGVEKTVWPLSKRRWDAPAVKSSCVRGTGAWGAPESAWSGHYIVYKHVILPTSLCFARVGDVLRRGPLSKIFLLTTTHHSTPTNRRKLSTAARPSAAKKGDSGVSPDYDTTQLAYEQKKAKHSGQAERSGEGGFGGLPRLRQSSS